MSYKVMLLGNSGVGKTSIARRLKFNSFETKHKSTFGLDLYSLETLTGTLASTIVLWDTVGSFGDMVFERVFLKGADAAIIVADISAADTIDSMLLLGDEIHQHLPLCPVYSMLNKSDLVKLSEDRMSELNARCPNLGLCSAKTGDGVMQAIESLAAELNSN